MLSLKKTRNGGRCYCGRTPNGKFEAHIEYSSLVSLVHELAHAIIDCEYGPSGDRLQAEVEAWSVALQMARPSLMPAVRAQMRRSLTAYSR